MVDTCKICGREHDVWPPDWALQRPDVVWHMPPADRRTRVSEGNDLCTVDGDTFFIRTVLKVPIVGRKLLFGLIKSRAYWGIGLWVEVAKDKFVRYNELFSEDGKNEPTFEGRIANRLRAFPEAFGQTVNIKIGNSTQRPTLSFSKCAAGKLALAQRQGLTDEELHLALALEGVLGE